MTIEVQHHGRTVRFRPCGGSIEAILRTNRFYEQQMLEYIEALALSGVYVDAGGYVGTHTLFFAAFCPASRVLAFEPRPHCLEHLRDNVAQNALGDRVAVHPFGLSDRDETVTVTLDRREVSFECHALDALVHETVALMKIDVEGMEGKVLAGASQVLERSRPLLFLEAHDQPALDALTAQLAPYGYAPTGRVFNHTPTYELAAASSPTAPPSRLPRVRSLLEPGWWTADDADVSVDLGATGLRVDSRLAAERTAHLTAAPRGLKKPPATTFLAPEPGATYFLEASGEVSAGLGAGLFVLEYRGAERTQVTRHSLGLRTFQRLALQPDTDRVRLALRVAGAGQLHVERLALHSLP